MKPLSIYLLTLFLSFSSVLNLNAQVYKTIHVASFGTLASQLSENEKSTVTNLTVTGNINAADILILHESMPVLKILDLSLVDIEGNSIPDFAFFLNPTIESIILPASVTSIGRYSFYFCSMLSSITIPVSVNSIGEAAFACSNNLDQIGVDASNLFYSSLDGVLFNKNKTTLLQLPAKRTGVYQVPSTVITIKDLAFFGCTGLTSVTIPGSVDSIGNTAFVDCSGLTAIIVATSNNHYSSDEGVLFSKDGSTLILCPEAKSGFYSIPSTVSTIGRAAFFECRELTSISIPSSVTSINSFAFNSCSKLASINIPSSVTQIRDNTFEECSALSSIVIPNSITSIDMNAFSGSGLTSVTIPPSVTYIGFGAFSSTPIRSVIIPSSVHIIESSTFFNCYNLQSVSIPYSVTFIGNNAFHACYKLTSITIPASVTSIGISAFEYCRSLKSLIIPPSVTTVKANAFFMCDSITSLIIPSSVENLGSSAFFNCSGLQQIKAMNTIPIDLISSNNVFSGIDLDNCTLLVPEGSENLYQSADKWEDFVNIITFHPELSITESELIIGSTSGSTATFNVISNTEWHVTPDVPWLVATPATGLDSSDIVLSAAANPNQVIRSSTVTVSAHGLPDRLVTVHQTAGIFSETNNFKITGLKVFPIPVTDFLQIHGCANRNITILDLQGKLMNSKTLVGDRESIDMSSLPHGVYILKIEGFNKTLTIPKL
jgi:hypothetical protein